MFRAATPGELAAAADSRAPRPLPCVGSGGGCPWSRIRGSRAPKPSRSDGGTRWHCEDLRPREPIDWRHRIEAKELARSATGTWTSPLVAAAFPFNELIYCWNVRLPKDEGFRLYLQVEFGPGDASPWLYAGFWGKVKFSGKRTKPSFDRGMVDEDTLQVESESDQLPVQGRGRR